MTGIATAIYEDIDAVRDADALARSRAAMARQLTGIESIAGTYPFDFARSVKAYRLNEFLHRMIAPAHRGRFLADPEGLFGSSVRGGRPAFAAGGADRLRRGRRDRRPRIA